MAVACALGSASACGRSDPPPPRLVVPVGYDAFRAWEKWDHLRIGTRTIMRSTYDRTGGNDSADASHYLRAEASGLAIPLDLEGAGVLSFVRTNFWHGSPWHYRVDGVDHVVTESSTASPESPVPGSVFLPTAAFPHPLALTWAETNGADLSWVPIPFRASMTLGYERTFYGTGYYIAQLFPIDASELSQPLSSWGEEPPPPDVVSLLQRAGTDIAPVDGLAVHEGTAAIPASGAALVTELAGSRTIRALRLRVAKSDALALGRARIRITWDDHALPSVDAPVALFFGAGTLYQREPREWLVKALPVNVHDDGPTLTLATYFPMTFFTRARIELVGTGEDVPSVAWHVRDAAYDEPPEWVGYFHATFRDHGVPVPGKDLVLLDTRETEGGGDRCGTFVGTSFSFSDRANLTTLEGDPRFFFDDSDSPQGYGTGTEEWAGGGNYWGGKTMTLPLAGHPVGAPSLEVAQSPEDAIESAYRFLLPDAMPFGRSARIQLEHGGYDDSTEHYRSVVFWYGADRACLVPTDALHVGDPNDEAAHAYRSPEASAPETLSSRWEWGVDHAGPVEIQPETSDVGRHTTTTSEMTFAIDPDNRGVLLRRKLDYGYADQRAEVFVADDRPDAPFVSVGAWLTAGSNRCVFSWPKDERGALAPAVQESNRRWREDELLLPRSLTAGRSRIRVRFVFAPKNTPLLPNDVPPRGPAWTEFRYWAYAWK